MRRYLEMAVFQYAALAGLLSAESALGWIGPYGPAMSWAVALCAAVSAGARLGLEALPWRPGLVFLLEWAACLGACMLLLRLGFVEPEAADVLCVAVAALGSAGAVSGIQHVLWKADEEQINGALSPGRKEIE